MCARAGGLRVGPSINQEAATAGPARPRHWRDTRDIAQEGEPPIQGEAWDNKVKPACVAWGHGHRGIAEEAFHVAAWNASSCLGKDLAPCGHDVVVPCPEEACLPTVDATVSIRIP